MDSEASIVAATLSRQLEELARLEKDVAFIRQHYPSTTLDVAVVREDRDRSKPAFTFQHHSLGSELRRGLLPALDAIVSAQREMCSGTHARLTHAMGLAGPEEE